MSKLLGIDIGGLELNFTSDWGEGVKWWISIEPKTSDRSTGEWSSVKFKIADKARIGIDVGAWEIWIIIIAIKINIGEFWKVDLD